ncbi:MAG: endonuclease [Clostridia bacterium]|nr:endonuclease [Clostridia bacterium]
MKERAKKICAAWIAVWILFSGSIHITVSAAPSSYSKTSNSGERGEICTTLEGTSAGSYYTGSYTYEAMAALSSGSLKSTLNTLLSSTHKKTTSYKDCKEKATSTDCENNDTGHFTTLYTSYSATYGQFNGGAGWNREHVWPQSLGGFKTSGAGADMHHIRPSESRTNNDRGNLKYGYVTGGSTSVGNLSGITGGAKGSSYYEPLDNVKGDVARIILYVYVRYYDEYSGCGSVTNVFQSVDVLLEWCELDPVDTWEMGRNEVVQNIQGNRNVFIDYPELAWTLFGEEVPEGMTTPSKGTTGTGGGSGGGSGSGSGGSDVTEPTVTPIATIIASSMNEYTAEGIVVARNAQSYLLKDETGIMMVYVKSMPEVEIGDKVRVTGSTTEYGGAVQFSQGAMHEVLGSEQVRYPVPTKLTGADCDEYLSGVSIDYVTVTGMLSTSGSGTKTYYNLAIGGADITGSITYPESTGQLSSLIGKEVQVSGYVTGVTGSSAKYLNLMMTDIREVGAEVCAHAETRLEGAESADCGNPGYTGDTYCVACGEKLSVGSILLPTGAHEWGTWTPVDGMDNEQRKCSVCDKTEDRTVSACGHLNAEIRDAVEANCTKEGYTGDTYCKDCGTLILKGKNVAVTSHEYGEAEIVKEATVDQTGLSQQTCVHCGAATYATIPMAEQQGNDLVLPVAISVGGVGLAGLVFFAIKKFVLK